MKYTKTTFVVLCLVILVTDCAEKEDIDPCQEPLLPSEIRFTQDSVGQSFSHQHLKGQNIGNVAMEIINRWPPPENSDFYFIRNNIEVARGSGSLSRFCFSASNRGLWVLKVVEDQINWKIRKEQRVQPFRFRVFPKGDIESNLRHPFTAIGNAMKIQIRGPARFNVHNIDLTSGFWEYKNRCLNKLLPSEIQYSTIKIPAEYKGSVKLYGSQNIETMANNIVMYWNRRLAQSVSRDIYNYNRCVENLTLKSQRAGGTLYCFASDNQCLWILRNVEERVRHVDRVTYRVVDGRNINLNLILDNGESIDVGGNQEQMERQRNLNVDVKRAE